MNKLIFISIFVLINSVLPEKFYLDDSTPYIIWSPSDPDSIEIQADEGYQIQVQVLELDLDGENDNYAIVKSVSDTALEPNEIMFTYTLSGTPNYFYNSEKIQADFVGSNSGDNKATFKFIRMGEGTTSTTTTTTQQPATTPDPTHTFTAYLYGLSYEAFNTSSIILLKETLADMASKYCKTQDCPLAESIIADNILIYQIQKCSNLWDNYESCVIITFSIPIKIEKNNNNVKWDGYQLNKAHLKMIWDIYKSELLELFNVSSYTAPENNSFVYIIVFVSIMVPSMIFAIYVLARIYHKIRRPTSESELLQEETDEHTSNLFLNNHYLQENPTYPSFSRNNTSQ